MAAANPQPARHRRQETGVLAESERLHSLLATLVAATRAVVGAESREALLRSVVDVLAGHGAFSMAFAAADLDGDGWLEPICSAGTGVEYIDGLRISVDDVPEGRGPAGTAIRTGAPAIITDIETDAAMAPWRERALGYGFQSTASFPLRSRAIPTAVLAIYAPVAGAFGEEEAALLEDLAVTVGYAVDALEDKAERAMYEAETSSRDAHLRGAFGALRDAVIVLTGIRENGRYVDERIEYTNAAWRAAILGDADAPDPVGARLLEVLPSFADRLPYHREVAETGLPYRATMVVPMPGGQRWYDTEYVPYGDGVIALSRDVTAQRAAEAAQAEADARFREAMDHAPIGMSIAGRDGRLVEANDALCLMLGRTPAELLGLHPDEFTHPDDIATDGPLRDAVLAGGRDGYRILKRYVRADGGVVSVDLSVGAVRDAEGNVTSLVAQVIDVTEQLAREASLRQSEDQYRELVDELDAIVFVHDIATGRRFVSANSERITGYPTTQLEQAEFWRDLVVEEDRERVWGVWDDVTVHSSDLHYRLRRADGRVIWVDERWRTSFGPDGQPNRWYAVTWDVTDRKRLEETVARTARLEAVGRVSAAAAHDFGNVLMGIRIFHGYLAMATPPDDPRAEDVQAIGQALERGTALTHQLLQLGRDSQDQELVPLDPCQVLHEMGALLKGVSTPSTLVIRTERVPAVRIPRRTLEQAVLNLVINARDAMLDMRGTVTMTVSTRRLGADVGLGLPRGRYVSISVADNGPGMPPHVLERALEPFFTTKPHGTGIGLPSVVGSIREAGGAVGIQSREGEGTTVDLLLPPVPVPRRAAAESV